MQQRRINSLCQETQGTEKHNQACILEQKRVDLGKNSVGSWNQEHSFDKSMFLIKKNHMRN